MPAEGKGTLYINDFAKHPKAPKWKGKFTVKGETYRLAAWEARNDEGRPVISIAVDEYKPEGAPKTYPREVVKDDDSIPF